MMFLDDYEVQRNGEIKSSDAIVSSTPSVKNQIDGSQVTVDFPPLQSDAFESRHLFLEAA